MSYCERTRGIVLQAHDVGEADRFCITFTRDLGRIALRAKGCRRLFSSSGSALLPLQECQLEVRKSGDYWCVEEAIQLMHITRSPWSLPNYALAIRGTELLLLLMEDGLPQEELYEEYTSFLQWCRQGQGSYIHFCISTLQYLGLLPKEEEHEVYGHLPQEERMLIQQAQGKGSSMAEVHAPHLQQLLDRIIATNANRHLRVQGALAHW